MARLIDADALKKTVDDFPNCYNGWSDTYDKAFIIGAIEEAPTIEAVSVVQGEWKISNLPKGDMKYCSECGFGQHIKDERAYNYCPNCGARMRGADDEC